MRAFSGTILPFPVQNRVPHSSALICALLVGCSLITSTTFGYDGSMINGLNILSSYTDYFELNTVTTSLNTASVWIGGILAGVSFNKVTDILGRRPALFWAAVITLVAVILQTAAQNIAMFVAARILIGFGTTASALTGPAYLAETLPMKWRAWGLGIFNDAYYVGGLIAAGVTYGTSFMQSTWAWRIPSVVQGAFSIMCILILPFIPESPRWLAYHGRTEEALKVVALTHADGDVSDPVVLTQYKEIIDTLEFEKSLPRPLSLKQMVKTPSARKRVVLCTSVAVFSTVAGNVIVSYYLGQMLDNAGITNQTTQLQINIILNAFCLVCSLVGTYYVERLGRKPTAVISITTLTVFLFLVGGLTKTYGNSTNNAGIYATVACIFLFMGAYSFGWTPLLYVYPPEVLNYAIRANGMGVLQLALNGTALMAVFSFPIALAAIGWKMYIINAAWNLLEIPFVLWYWVETKGKTLEEIDEVLDGEKHTDAPDLIRVMRGSSEKVYVDDEKQ
ncbi:Hexose transporter protein [Mycena indigotica]|uniref:Hexose transporter protein n=1 Tax=Mycena indigotica TaxID=2126181 RepID=A0A8H6SH23_9AGAR|nr:Hexose transporter protein [Mycena indigotica]KAF7298823.1 Hexose transporter protein [Mycena indigotica]